MKKYQYKPLLESPEAIRVLRVHKQATEHSLIECSLHDASISTTEYIALSYVWGTDLPTYKILLDGVDFFVRPTLWYLLQYAQKNLNVENLWVDDLCIDQTDEQEKNTQVALMGKIYTQAIQVRSWLNGKRSVFTAAEDHASGASLLAAAITDHALRRLDLRKPYEVLPALARLIMNEYWSRAWIVQELLLAKDVLLLWEGHKIAWDHLMHVFENDSKIPSNHSAFEMQLSSNLQTIYDHSFDKLAFFGVLDYARLGNLNCRPPLIDVMLTFRYHQSSDFHDRAFAFVGLADMSGPAPFEINYNDSADELWCRIVYAAVNLPSDDEMKALAQLMNVNSTKINLPANHYARRNGSDQLITSQSRDSSMPNLCPRCFSELVDRFELRSSGELDILTTMVPGTKLVILSDRALRASSSERYVPRCAVHQQDKTAASTLSAHADSMRLLEPTRDISLNIQREAQRDHYLTIQAIHGASISIQEWIRSQEGLVSPVLSLVSRSCSAKHDIPDSDCCQHFLATARSIRIDQASMDTSDFATSQSSKVVDMGHWRFRPHRVTLDDEEHDHHFFLLVDLVFSVPHVAKGIYSELARFLRGALPGYVWLMDCPSSTRSTRKEVLRLIAECKQVLRNSGDPWSPIDMGWLETIDGLDAFLVPREEVRS